MVSIECYTWNGPQNTDEETEAQSKDVICLNALKKSGRAEPSTQPPGPRCFSWVTHWTTKNPGEGPGTLPALEQHGAHQRGP